METNGTTYFCRPCGRHLPIYTKSKLDLPRCRTCAKLQSHKYTCHFTGLSSKEVLHVADAFDWQCMYCDKPLDEFEHGGWTLDHVRPKCYGGSNTADNVGPACPSCGAKKHTKTMEEFVGFERSQTIRARHPFMGTSPLYVVREKYNVRIVFMDDRPLPSRRFLYGYSEVDGVLLADFR